MYENCSELTTKALKLLVTDPYFPAFGLSTERYGVSSRIQSECGKIRTRKTPNMDTFHSVRVKGKGFYYKHTTCIPC